MTFADALKAQINRNGANRGKTRRLTALLNERPSRRRDRALNRLEEHALVHLRQEGFDNIADKAEEGDWSGVSDRDWNKFFTGLLSFLMAILPLILPLFTGTETSTAKKTTTKKQKTIKIIDPTPEEKDHTG